MRDLRLLVEGTSVLALTGGADRNTCRRQPLKMVEDDVYGRLARRRRRAQMAARRVLGVHDDVDRGRQYQ